jgi:transposase-like protein
VGDPWEVLMWENHTRGFSFTHETVRAWEERFAPLLTARLKAQRRGKAGRRWHVDETYIKVEGRWCYLYRAIDADGNLLETLLSPTRDMDAAKRFFTCALDTAGQLPTQVTTDKHGSYPRAIRETLGPAVRHRTSQYLWTRPHDTRTLWEDIPPRRSPTVTE